jgi:hypothetical protein
MVTNQLLTEAIELLFLHKPPKKEVTTDFIRDCIAAYWDKPSGEINMQTLREVLRGMVGNGVVPRTMWRQKSEVPEIRWVFVLASVPARPAPAKSKKKHDPRQEKPFVQGLTAKRINSKQAS